MSVFWAPVQKGQVFRKGTVYQTPVPGREWPYRIGTVFKVAGWLAFGTGVAVGVGLIAGAAAGLTSAALLGGVGLFAALHVLGGYLKTFNSTGWAYFNTDGGMDGFQDVSRARHLIYNIFSPLAIARPL
jgi:hypothetical protein